MHARQYLYGSLLAFSAQNGHFMVIAFPYNSSLTVPSIGRQSCA